MRVQLHTSRIWQGGGGGEQELKEHKNEPLTDIVFRFTNWFPMESLHIASLEAYSL